MHRTTIANHFRNPDRFFVHLFEDFIRLVLLYYEKLRIVQSFQQFF